MNATQIESRFAQIGARLKASVVPAQDITNDYAVDIRKDRRGQFFELRVAEPLRDQLDVSVPHADKADRHLLLFVREPEGTLARFLCGHDEREWFVAAVPGGAASVPQAKEALQPQAIRNRLSELEVPTRLQNRRRNAAFLRQGEWFFVTLSYWDRVRINEKFILHNEPLRRGTGKPHFVEQLFRTGGEVVYVTRRHPNALSEFQYRALIRRQPSAATWRWEVLRRNPRVYARGRVRHSDHATITLPDWHRVVLNTETETEAMRNVAFID